MGRFYNWYRRMFPVIDYRVAARDDLAQAKFDLLYTQAEIEDQEWSLNPGRYVGVVIEEDGKTEDEFIAGLMDSHDEWHRLNEEALELEGVLAANVKLIAGVT